MHSCWAVFFRPLAPVQQPKDERSLWQNLQPDSLGKPRLVRQRSYKARAKTRGDNVCHYERSVAFIRPQREINNLQSHAKAAIVLREWWTIIA